MKTAGEEATRETIAAGSRVSVVDDDLSMRDSLRSLLRAVGYEVQLFDSVSHFLAAHEGLQADCLVLDVRLPGQSGLELQRELLRSGINLPIVFITGHGDVPMSVAAMKAGAIEFLTKPFRDQDLLEAVRRGTERTRRRRDEAELMTELRRRYDSLSVREREVMTLVCSGRMNKQIAAELQLSEITVKVHRGKVMRKMRAGSLPELVRLADRLESAAKA